MRVYRVENSAGQGPYKDTRNTIPLSHKYWFSGPDWKSFPAAINLKDAHGSGYRYRFGMKSKVKLRQCFHTSNASPIEYFVSVYDVPKGSYWVLYEANDGSQQVVFDANKSKLVDRIKMKFAPYSDETSMPAIYYKPRSEARRFANSQEGK